MFKTLLITIFFITSCSSVQNKTDKNGTPIENLEEVSGKNYVEGVDQTEIHQSKASKENNIAVIVGPGGANTMASVGVLKVLEAAELNIKYIAGLGWGSVSAAIYANNLKPHELEWQFYKLKGKPLWSSSFIGSKKKYLDYEKIITYFNEVMGSKRIDEFLLPFACPTQSKDTGEVELKISGLAKLEVMKCLTYSPFFKKSNDWFGAPKSYAKLVEYLHAKDVNFIIYIDNLTGVRVRDLTSKAMSVTSQLFWNDLLQLNRRFASQSDFQFNINTKGYRVLDFTKSKDLIKIGDVEAKKKIKLLEEKLAE